MTDNGFEQLVDFPTHVRGNILDLVITNRPENIINIEPIGNLATSDHSILSIDLVVNTKFNNSAELISDWKNGDTDGLKSYLADVDWDQELGNLTADGAW